MDKTPPNFLLWVTTLFSCWLALGGTQGALAQSRGLQQSRFNTYSGSGGPLPSAGGLHLQEGRERPKGAPAGVYNPGEPKLDYKLVRWESRFMPLKVWLSPGKRLREEPISVINAQRPQEVLQLLKQDPALNSLPQCPGWEPEMNSAAKTGIEQWKEFENEGLFSFVFVDDPAQANIFLFWTPRFSGDEGVGGVSTGGNTVAVLYDANEVHTREAAVGRPLQGTPVIMELQVAPDSYEKLQARVAHEFGHALGIKEHSPYNEDLMCVNGIAKYLSPSDKATIRWLYRQSPQYVMLPPVLPPVAMQTNNQEQQQEQQQEQSGNNEAASLRPRGPAGGYRIHMSRSSAEEQDHSAAQSHSNTSAAEKPFALTKSPAEEPQRSRPDRKEENPDLEKKQKKNKHHKRLNDIEDSGSAKSTDSARDKSSATDDAANPDSTGAMPPAPRKQRASDGY